ncbi:MAG: ABC transporter permease [Acholeplasmatales bacterium]|nr:ABC transporter permease [Acholeplasmatales bacterium]
MFFRLIKGTFFRQWKKMFMIALTIALGTSIATAMINVMLDVSDKINEELKAYGANITVVSKNAAVLSNLYESDDESESENMYLPEDTCGELLTIFWANNIREFNPSIDGNVKYNGNDVKLVGSWFNHHYEYVKKASLYQRDTGITNLRSWWNVTGSWIDEIKSTETDVCMVGINFSKKYNIKVGDNIEISNKKLNVIGIYESGDKEDEYIYTTLDNAQTILNKENLVKSIAVSAITSPDDELSERAAKNPNLLSMADYDLWYCTAYVSSICYQIQEAVPQASATVIRQVADSEGNILNKTQLLMTLITVLSLIGAALGISNLVTSSVMERSSELGLLKAIGAKNSSITILVLTEVLITAILGELIGYFMGFGFAQIIGQTVFASSINMRGIAAFVVAFLITLVVIIGSIPAVRLLLRLKPSEVLHGR